MAQTIITTRNISLDILKLLLAFMVVGLHAKFLADTSALGEFLTVNGLFRIAVPIFFIINGFYFYPTTLKNKQMQWLKRVFILYVVWMTVYAYFWVPMPEISIREIAKLIFRFLIGYHHLWYLSGIIGAAIMLLVCKNLGEKTLLLLIGITFSTGLFIQYAGNYHIFSGTILDKLFNLLWFYRNFLLFAFPFFCIGFLIHKHLVHTKVPAQTAFLLTLLGMTLLLAESYINYYQPSRDGGFGMFVSLILVCPALFISFIKQPIEGHSKNLSLYASAIYFIHPLILRALQYLTEANASTLTLLTIIISVIVSALIIKINERIGILL